MGVIFVISGIGAGITGFFRTGPGIAEISLTGREGWETGPVMNLDPGTLG